MLVVDGVRTVSLTRGNRDQILTIHDELARAMNEQLDEIVSSVIVRSGRGINNYVGLDVFSNSLIELA